MISTVQRPFERMSRGTVYVLNPGKIFLAVQIVSQFHLQHGAFLISLVLHTLEVNQPFILVRDRGVCQNSARRAANQLRCAMPILALDLSLIHI